MTAAALPNDSDVFSSLTGSSSSQREQPFLYPFNRRLRHLKGISLRNLTLESPSSRSRGKSNDDELLPQSWKSPGKLKALKEDDKLSQPRSSSNLKELHDNDASQTLAQSSLVGNIDQTPQPSPRSRMRRRSTANWTGASPAVRQKKLEDVAGERLADTFFSLHAPDREDPIYISETIAKAMNPSFAFFDLNFQGPSITRLEHVVVKLWAKTETMDQFIILVELDVNFLSLQYLGKELSQFHHTLPSNCICFHLSDGVYTSFTDMPIDTSFSMWPYRAGKKTSGKTENTSSFESLMKLANMDDCIQDAVLTRTKFATQIDQILASNQKQQDIFDTVASTDQQLLDMRKAVATERKRLESSKLRKEETILSLQARRQALRQGIDGQDSTEHLISEIEDASKDFQTAITSHLEDMQGQRRRISEDLQRIYPIEPIPDQPLAFTIREMHLPNTNFEDVDEDATAAALGYAAELVFLLSCYLFTPLPYPLFLCASTSTIDDPIAIMAGSRTYPLFPKGSIAFRFEYGVFLLDKNIETLLNRVGLRVLDIRHTLPNLKYLLYVLAAGKGEIPARKAGGIKGLLGVGRSPMMSRTNSQDSEVGVWTQRIAGLGLKHKTAAQRLKAEEL